MSVGEASIGLNLGIARLDSDTREAERILNRIGRGVIANSQQAEKAISQLSSVGVTSVDRLQSAFSTLNIKSSLQIDNEKARIITAFDQIKNSGVASMDEISRASAATKAHLDRLDGKNVMSSHQHGMDLFSLKTFAAIAAMQVLYTVINKVFSGIASIPKTAADAIENYSTSVITSAAVITSMQGNVKDVGKAYQENKVYAEAVEKVLVKMDAETVASYSQLQKMNQAFVQQGVLLDVNNKKAIDGYRDIANAIAVIAKTSPNPDMQFYQEVKGLMAGEAKAGNQLFAQLSAIDPKLKEHLATWKAQGTVIEHLGPLLQGYAAASGDINSLWSTVKSTLATIRDEIFRGGLSGAMGEIVATAKELSKYIEENKEKIQAFLRDGFADAKAVAKFIWEWSDGFVALGKASLFLAITSGVASVIEKIKLLDQTFKGTALFKILQNPVTALAIATIYGGYKTTSQVNENERLNADAATANRIASSVSQFGNKGPQFTADNMADFYKAFPLAGPELLALAKSRGAASLVPTNLAGGSDIYKLKMDLDAIKKIQDGIQSITTPKIKTPGDEGNPAEANPIIDKWNSLLRKEKTGISELEDKLYQNSFDFQKFMDDYKASKEKTLLRSRGITEESIKQEKLVIDNQIRSADWEKRMVAVAAQGQAQTDTAASIFNLNNRYSDDLKTDRYKVTPLSKYRLSTSFYGIKQASVSQSQIDTADSTINTINDKIDQKRGRSDIDVYDTRLAAIKKVHDEEYKEIDRYLQMEGALVEKANAAKLKSDQLYAQEKAKLDNPGTSGFIDGLKKYSEAVSDIYTQVENMAVNSFKSMEDALVKFTQTGKLNFHDMAMSILADLSRILIRQSITGPIAEGLKDFSFSSLFGGGKASGGPVDAKTTYLVGEQGPELFTPASSGVITPNHALGGSNVNLTVSVVNQSGQPVKAKQGGTTFDGRGYVKTIILEALDSDPGFRGAVRGY